MYFDVAPSIPLPASKDVYTYHSGKSLPAGTVVSVPVGKQLVEGVVIRKVGKKPPYRTKDIARVFPVSLTPEQLALGATIAGANLGGLGYTLRLFYPPSLHTPLPMPKRKRTSRNFSESSITIGPQNKRIMALQTTVQRALEEGHQALILVPERWMTTRFPWATPLHAGMRVSQARPVWNAVAAGTPIAIVGTQKALFLPWRRLAILAIEEEQLSTHKLWDGYPRGDNRRLASWATRIYGASHIASAPFPSLATHHQVQAKTEKPTMYAVRQPLFDVVPYSFEDRQHRRLIPNRFVELVRRWKQEKKNVVILHNEKDGSVAKALQALRLLKKGQIAIGTSALLAQAEDTKFDQVVWMFPEIALSFPDIRSSERGYVLLARLHTMLTNPKSSVTLVTRQPEFVDRVFSGTVAQVYTRLLAERKKFWYPPYSDMVRLTYRSKTLTTANGRAKNARQAILKKLVSQRDSIRVLGPYGQSKKKKQHDIPEVSLLLLGDIDVLTPALKVALPDTVEIDPQEIL